jgi:hypothetical protein
MVSLPEKEVRSMSLPWVRFLAVSLGLWGLASGANAQNQFTAPPLLQVPSAGPSTGFPPFPGTGRSAGVQYNQIPDVAPVPAGVQPLPNGNGTMGDTLYAAGTNGDEIGNCCADACCPKWYVGAGLIHMRRDRGAPVALSFDGTDPNNILVDTQPCNSHWESGFEFTLGWCLCCSKAIEVTYWGVTALDSSDLALASAQGTGTLDTFLDFTGLTLNGVAVGDLYNTTTGAHLVVRDSRFHNVEINFLHEVCGDGVCRSGVGMFGCGHGCGGHGCGHGCGHCRSWSCTWLAGVRYFQYFDNMLYATSDDNETFEFDANEAYYGVNVYNHLIGGQIGARLDYALGRSVSLYAMPKFGVFGNHITSESRLYTLGDTAIDLRASKNDVALLAQLDLGVNVWLTSHWMLYAGYRAVAATGVANAEEQIPRVMASTADIANLDSTGEVIVHGGFAGIQYSW